MSKEVEYKDLIAFHPGSYVEDIIDDLNITQAEFAERLGTSSKTVSKIINGEENISDDIANKLAKLTGISIKTWLDLQTNYNLKVLEIVNSRDDDEREICNMIDFGYFKDNGFIEKKHYSVTEKINELRKLLNFSNLSNLFEFNSMVSYRNTQKFTEKSIVNSNVMLELATNVARNVTENKYKKEKLLKALPSIRSLVVQPPEIFYPKLKEILLNCGIVLVGLPKLTNANLNGATKKFKNGSVLLLVTDRNKSSDIFWFSFVHELGHVFYEDFYSNYEDKETYSKKEKKADEFARNFFISPEKYQEFVEDGNFSESSIKQFSEDTNILPSILVGRLQNDKLINYSALNYLKSKYIISF